MKKLVLAAAALAVAAPVAPAFAAPPPWAPAYGKRAKERAAYERRAARYYRSSDHYAARPLGYNDRVYRGSDGRYYCRRSDGTVGLVVGAGVGALIGRGIDTRGERGTGTILGATLGALLGRQVERSSDLRCR